MHERTLPDEVFAGLDRDGPVPLYTQVAERLEALIADGSLPTGSRLENEIAMSARFGLSRPTIRQAIKVLVDKGLLVRRRGAGTQVVHDSITRRTELGSLWEDLQQAGRRPTTRVLGYETLPPSDELVARLGVDIATPVLHLRRLRSADGEPIAILENFLGGAPAIGRADLESRGLYGLLRQRGIQVRVSRQSVSTREATPEEAELLGIRAGAPVLVLARTAYDQSGQVVEVGTTLYRQDRYTIEFTLVSP